VKIAVDARYGQPFPSPSALKEITITNMTVLEAMQIILDTCALAGFPLQKISNNVVVVSSPILLRFPKFFYLGLATQCDSDMNTPITTQLNPDDLFNPPCSKTTEEHRKASQEGGEGYD
jgi:hypothetical protein